MPKNFASDIIPPETSGGSQLFVGQSPMKRIKALCFDLDETLLDGSEFARSIEDACIFVSLQRPGLEPEHLLEANRSVFSELGPATAEDWMLGRLSGIELSQEAWRRTLMECGEKDASLALLACTKHLELARKTYRLFDDAAEVLNALLVAGIPLALVTNGASDTQRDKLESLGILEQFDLVMISGETGVAKPDARVFSAVLEALDCPAPDIWHVGDSLVTDVVGARAAGLTSVWLNRTGTPADRGIRPDVEIATLKELLQYVDNP